MGGWARAGWARAGGHGGWHLVVVAVVGPDALVVAAHRLECGARHEDDAVEVVERFGVAVVAWMGRVGQ